MPGGDELPEGVVDQAGGLGVAGVDGRAAGPVPRVAAFDEKVGRPRSLLAQGEVGGGYILLDGGAELVHEPEAALAADYGGVGLA